MADGRLLEWVNAFSAKYGATAAAPADDLEREYERLGGDAALLDLLAAEDRYFMTLVAKERTLASDRADRRRIELRDKQARLQPTVEIVRAAIAREEKRLAAEKPQLDELRAAVQALGEKVRTEPGKELLHQLEHPIWSIGRAPRIIANDRRWLDGAERVLAAIERRLQDVDRTYEAVEARLAATRVERRNLLELRALPIAERVERLRGGSAEARAKAQKKVEQELAALRNASEERVDREIANFVSHHEPYVEEPYDWGAVEKLLAKVRATSLDELRKTDRKHDRLLRKYEEAGGDEALYRGRVEDWKLAKEMQQFNQSEKSNELQQDAERLRQQVVEAEKRLSAAERTLEESLRSWATAKRRAEQLAGSAQSGDLLSKRESAELQVLGRELERLQARIDPLQAEVDARRRELESAEQLAEERRRLNETRIDDDQFGDMRKPQPRDLDSIPLRRKYEELTSR